MPDIFVGNPAQPQSEAKETSEVKTVEEPVQPKPHITPQKGKHVHSHLFSAFCDHPNAVRVADLQDDEEILLYLRRHIITNAPWIIRAIGSALVFPFMFYINSFGIIDTSFIPYNFIIFATILYYQIVFSYVFVKYLSWFYNISLVTDKRIIDIDFSSLIYENVDATKLSQVEDVGYAQIGIIRSIFDYGDVNLHTAGPSSNFEFLAVPHPERIIKIINNLIGKTKHA